MCGWRPSKGVYKTPVELSEEFVNQFCVRISNVVSEQFNKANNVLEAETDVLRISIIHPSVTNTGCAISLEKHGCKASDRREND